MRYFFDTEFIERPGTLELISIGMVSEDRRELYAISTEFDRRKANVFVRENVLPKLPRKTSAKGRAVWKTRAAIRDEIRAFVGDDKNPQFWAYFADYDWVLFCWLFGAMVKLPEGWPMLCLDLKQSMIERGLKREHLPPNDFAHEALADARWLRESFDIVFPPNSF